MAENSLLWEDIGDLKAKAVSVEKEFEEGYLIFRNELLHECEGTKETVSLFIRV